MEYTGERLVPGASGTEKIFLDHMARYYFAGQFVKGKVVLDAGCGEGYGSSYLAKNKAGKVVGIDISEETINHSKTKYKQKNLFFKKADCLDLPFESLSFDIVVAFEIVEHIKRYEDFMDELKRVLKKKGLLIISTPNKKMLESANMKNRFHCREFSRQEFLNLLKRNFKEVLLLEQTGLMGSEISESKSKKRLNRKVIAEKSEAEYFLAICSDSNIRSNFSNVNIIGRSRYINSMEKIINDFKEALESKTREVQDRTREVQDLKRIICLLNRSLTNRICSKIRKSIEVFR